MAVDLARPGAIWGAPIDPATGQCTEGHDDLEPGGPFTCPHRQMTQAGTPGRRRIDACHCAGTGTATVAGGRPGDPGPRLDARYAAGLLGSWNGSWNGGAESPSVLGAVAALSCGIGAGSGPEAWEHASCKRQVELVRGTCVTAGTKIT